MTDEELDEARADHACQRDQIGNRWDTALAAARLAREGWRPPDPLEAEAEKIIGADKNTVLLPASVERLVRSALEHGIEIGRNRGIKESRGITIGPDVTNHN